MLVQDSSQPILGQELFLLEFRELHVFHGLNAVFGIVHPLMEFLVLLVQPAKLDVLAQQLLDFVLAILEHEITLLVLLQWQGRPTRTNGSWVDSNEGNLAETA